MLNEKLITSKVFSKQLNIGTALSYFINDILYILGENVSVLERKPITFSEYFYVELIIFSNNCKIRTRLRRIPDTLEIEAMAFSEPNIAHLSTLTIEELSLICSLVKEQHHILECSKYMDVNKHEMLFIHSLLNKLQVITGELT